MRFDELAVRLNKLYSVMQKGEKSNTYFLFAKLYTKEIDLVKKREGIETLVLAAGVKESFKTEINKGLKLAPYIEINPDYAEKLYSLIEKEKI